MRKSILGNWRGVAGRCRMIDGIRSGIVGIGVRRGGCGSAWLGHGTIEGRGEVVECRLG